MNLIEQLQTTLKWGEFEQWYEGWRESNKKNYHTFNIEVFKQYCLDIQKGVFEKFIESREGVFEQTEDAYCNKTFSIWTIQRGYTKNKSFEELLIWYFNN